MESWPVHSARRSFLNFLNHFKLQQDLHPDLTLAHEDLMLHTVPTEVEPKAFFHYASGSREILESGMAEHWQDFKDRMIRAGLERLEVWAGGSSDADLLERYGFVRGDEMAWYHCGQLIPYPPDVRLRAFDEAGDFERLLAIHHATSPTEWWLSHDAYLAWTQTVETRVLEIDGQIAGFTHLRQIEQQGLFDGLAVHPDFQRRGLATALVKDSISWFASQGVQTIDLFVLTTNDAALALYDRLGFQRMGLQVQMKLGL